jgi:purine-cytosine permease-like protein
LENRALQRNGQGMAAKKTKMHFGIDPRTREIVVGAFRMKLPESRWLRTTIGVLLVCGGLLGFLPVLGFWMIPLGLLVLSHDSHFVRRQRRRLAVWWASRKARRNAR